MKSIILIAPPAAGKGTQSDLIKNYYNYQHISTGDLLREVALTDTDRGREIKSLLEQGQLVSDDIIFELLLNKLNDCGNGYILDGFPRNLEQANKYDEIMQKMNVDSSVVIYLDINKEDAMKRILGRTSCSSCGAVYNDLLEESAPVVKGICDRCGSSLVKRNDDNEETFVKRYDQYLFKTKPLIDFYQSKGVLFKFDATMDKMVIFDQIKSLLGENND